MLRKDALLSAIWSIACAFGLAMPALAQEGAPRTPTLPEVEVNPAQQPMPEVVTDPNAGMGMGDNTPYEGDLPFTNGDEWPGGSLLQGGAFSSGPVRGYRAGTSTASTLFDAPDADVPGTVSVVPQDVLNDQQALQIQDVVRNAGGVVASPNGGSFFYDEVFIRGIQLTSRDYRRDGFLDPTIVPRDFHNIDRIEILKGPASMLYGPGSPAGMINLVTKKPVDAQFAGLGYTFGAYQQSRYTVDANSRVTESGNVLVRFNGMQEDRNSFTQFDFLSRTGLAPSVTWLVNDSTAITYQADWHRDDRRGFQGLPVLGGDPEGLPQNAFVGLPNDFFNTEEFRQSLVLTHELNENWTFRLGGYTLWDNYQTRVTRASDNFTFLPPVPEPLFYRAQSSGASQEQSHSMIANLAGEFYTGELRHRSVIGTEYIYFDAASNFQLDPLTPDFATTPTFTSAPFLPLPLQASDVPVFRQQRVGVYAQDLVDLTPQWKVLGGVRLDSTRFTYDRDNVIFGMGTGPLSSQQDFFRASPRGGLIFQPFADETLAGYFNYSQSFQPPGGGIYTNGTFINPTPLKPILGEIYEAGIKTTLLENLTLNACGFYITRENAELYDGAAFFAQVGEERSRGAEVNLLGNITDRWSAVANYTYVDVRLYDPNFAVNGIPMPLNGQRQRSVPFNSGNIWTRYNLIQDEVHTFGAALGMIASDLRPGDLANSFFLPGYTRWDSGVYYNRGQFNANVYLENIFDTYYDTSSLSAYQVYPGAPFNVRATVAYVF